MIGPSRKPGCCDLRAALEFLCLLIGSVCGLPPHQLLLPLEESNARRFCGVSGIGSLAIFNLLYMLARSGNRVSGTTLPARDGLANPFPPQPRKWFPNFSILCMNYLVNFLVYIASKCSGSTAACSAGPFSGPQAKSGSVPLNTASRSRLSKLRVIKNTCPKKWCGRTLSSSSFTASIKTLLLPEVVKAETTSLMLGD